MNRSPADQGEWIELPVTNVLTLAAVAAAGTRYPWLDFRDSLAERVWRSLGADASHISDIELRAALARTLEIDKLVRRWALGREGGWVVELGSGLSTRHARLLECTRPLASVDVPRLASVRRDVFPESSGFVQVSAPLEERGWIRALVATRGAPFVVVEDAFLDSDGREVLAILCALAAELPRGSLIAASHGPRARFVVADATARRASLGVRVVLAGGRAQIARFPRLAWVLPPSPLDGTELAAVALLEVL